MWLTQAEIYGVEVYGYNYAANTCGNILTAIDFASPATSSSTVRYTPATGVTQGERTTLPDSPGLQNLFGAVDVGLPCMTLIEACPTHPPTHCSHLLLQGVCIL